MLFKQGPETFFISRIYQLIFQRRKRCGIIHRWINNIKEIIAAIVRKKQCSKAFYLFSSYAFVLDILFCYAIIFSSLSALTIPFLVYPYRFPESILLQFRSKTVGCSLLASASYCCYWYSGSNSRFIVHNWFLVIHF
jgi:hypothetical protein